MNYIHYYQSPLGEIILTSDGKSLTGLSYDFPEMLLPYFIEKPLPIFSETDRWLDIYFSGKNPDFTPKLSLKVTGFRKMVWDILLTIPFGQTITYGEIASRIAKQRGIPRMSAQAVGGAVGRKVGGTAETAVLKFHHAVIGGRDRMRAAGTQRDHHQDRG